MFSNKRPKPGETEEELLIQQKAFLQALHLQQRQGAQQSFQPAATVVKKAKRDNENETNPQSLASGSNGQRQSDLRQEQLMDVEGDSDSADEIRNESDCKPSDSIDKPLLRTSIVERPFDPTKLLSFSSQRILPKVDMNKVSKSSACTDTKQSGSRRGKSLFARSFDASFGKCASDTSKSAKNTTESQGGSVKIRDETPSLSHMDIMDMTEQEILEERNKVIEKLGPDLVKFIMSRNKKTEQQNISNMEVDKDEAKLKINITASKQPVLIEDSELPIDPDSVRQFPGMDNIQKEKLAWTGLIKEERIIATPSEAGANARFDFDGKLIMSQEISDLRTFENGLHHHGEEMNRAGYTLEELLTLVRSTKGNQRAIALETIANIYENAHTGMYDLYFEKSLFQLADYMDFVYAIRTGLDNEDKTSVNAALSCLGAILYPWEEEICLDIVYLWDEAKPHPWLSTKSENLDLWSNDTDSAENQMKDIEILQLDLIDFLVHRSNLLARISYFLKIDSSILTQNGVQGIMKILIRVARHSPNTLIAHKDLIRLLIKNYAPPDWRTSLAVPLPTTLKGVPLPMALKIIRILIDSSQQNASIIYTEFSIFPTVVTYLANDEWHLENQIQKTEFLILESFRIWIAFIAQGIGINEYAAFFPVLIKFTKYYLATEKLHPFDMLHSAHLFSLLLAILRMNEDSKGIKAKDRHSHWGLVKDVVTSVEQFVQKVVAFLCSPHLKDSYDQDATLFSLSKALKFLIETCKYRDNKMSPVVVSAVHSLIKSNVYGRLTTNLRRYSVILMDREEGNRYPSNFASVKAVRFGGKWNPIIEFQSSLPFLASLLAFLKFSNDFEGELVMNAPLTTYVAEILKSNVQSDQSDFFVRFELLFLCELIELLPKNAPERFSIAYKAVSEVPKECPKLFNRLFKLALESSCNESDRVSAFDIFGGYLIEVEEDDEDDTVNQPEQKQSSESSKKKVTFEEGTKPAANCSSGKLEFRLWSERCIRSHWILEPLKRMRTIVTTIPGYLKNHIEEIEMQCRVCLQLIEKCLESYCGFILQTPNDFLTVYCRICQVFLLGEPGIYIDEKIAPILKNILRVMINCDVIQSCRDKCVFSKAQPQPGVPDMFLDFYPDLLREFTNNSYFNEVFAQFLLIPLRTPEASQIKSNFWTLDCLNCIRIKEQQSIIPVEYLTSGMEKSPQMLGLYKRLVDSGRISKDRNEFLFQVLKSHLAKSDEVLKQELTNLKI